MCVKSVASQGQDNNFWGLEIFSVSTSTSLKCLAVVQEFCEDCPDQKKVVVRGAKYKDNATLPGAVEEFAGDIIYRGLRDGFRVSIWESLAVCSSVQASLPEETKLV